jgi:hypothetical protein
MTSIDMLPDEVLLTTFGFCEVFTFEDINSKKGTEAWQSLVHVCRRWRSIVFGSPRRLNLRLVSTPKTSVRELLDVWPPLPLVIQNIQSWLPLPLAGGVDNIVAALEHRDRADEIYLQNINSSALEKVLAVMQEPFPELRSMRLSSDDETVPVVPDSFLGGSAPRLEFLVLECIPFPGLPKLLLSSTHLIDLYLSDIPHSGYISPDAMVTALSTLTNLQSLRLKFQSPRPHPDPAFRRLLPPTRSVLPVLRRFSFKGVYEYLDDFVARIDAPRLDELSITFFNDIVFDAPRFIRFINHTPTLKAPDNAYVVLEYGTARVNFSSRTSGYRSLEVRVSCRERDWQVSSLEQVCTSCLPPLSTTEGLYFYAALYWPSNRQNNIESSLWLDLLHPFIAVKNLYLSKEFAPLIVAALQELVASRTTEVLPALQNIFLEEPQPSGPVQEGIGKFVAARRLSGHPIIVSLWEMPVTEEID